MKPLARLGSLLAGAYLGALLAVSLGSEELLLPVGTAKQFCGAYLDCHLGVAVLGTRALEPDPTAPGARRVLVRLRVTSDARLARLSLRRPVITLVDEDGRRWRRSAAAERTLGLAPDGELTAPLDPGRHREVTLAFVLPGHVRQPRLLVREGSVLDRIAELFLLGDEDSLLHAPVTLAIPLDG